MTEPAPGGSPLRRFARENGLLLLLLKITAAVPRRVRDALLSRRLHTQGLRLGRSPRLLGLAHMRIGAGLAAGNDLWLEAVTEYGGVAYEPLLMLGAHANLSDAVHIACLHRVTIGGGLLCGSRVLITDHNHGVYSAGTFAASSQSAPTQRPVERTLSSGGEVRIGANVWLGDGTVVLAGADIGDGAVIGANSVVTGMIPPDSIAAGAPARVLRQWSAEASEWR